MEGNTGKKLAKSVSGLRMVPTSENYSSPFALEEPMWTPDSEAAKCMSCEEGFTFMNRRHHCRRCGKCFCGRCCDHHMPLQRMYFVDPVRHCYECAILSKKEAEFYDKNLKILTAGTVQNITQNVPDVTDKKELGLFECHVTKDHRYIEFTVGKGCHNESLPPPRILLTKVTGAQMLTDTQSPTGSPGGQIASGIEIKYKDEENSAVVYSLTLRSMDHRTSAPWLASVQKAMRMLFESRKQRMQE